MQNYPVAKFTIEDAGRAYDEWGANCGPGALAGIMGKTLDEIRPHMGDFERKGYTNPMLMYECLKSLGVVWYKEKKKHWPKFGLARIQWTGAWTKPGVPARAAYRHTHWVACVSGEIGKTMIFDINCMAVGGCVTLDVWVEQVVPWLLKEVEPKADGGWFVTHCIEVKP